MAQPSQTQQIRIMCPSLACKRVLTVPISSRGRKVRCRGCGTTILVPVEKSEEKPAPDRAAG